MSTTDGLLKIFKELRDLIIIPLLPEQILEVAIYTKKRFILV